ncbi:MAG: hypothetical protein IPK82_12345 [Polyangiaceae bacterium]|nr:hypothetical protein [Polyangiaceae bacterium]
MANPESAKETKFREAFSRWARRVRMRLSLGVVLTGVTVGLIAGAGGAAALWKLRQGTLRPWAAGAGIVGALVGAVVAQRRRWNDAEVALFLDAKLGANEAISTAVDLGKDPESGSSKSKKDKPYSDQKSKADRRRDSDPAQNPGYFVVLNQATEALEKATAKRVKTRVLRPVHATLPLAIGAIGFLSWIPLPPAPALPPPPPGAEEVKLAEVKGLEKVIALAELNARDDAQRERLKKLAEDARKLQQKLKEGVEKREAQAELAKIKDGLMAERLSLGEGEERQGLENALGKMAENSDLKDAAKALGDRDLTSFDEEMQKLANKLERQDRERAKKTLEEAAEAAKKAGAQNVAKALEEQKKRLDKKGAEGDALKELAKELGDSLPDDAKEALRDMEKSGSPKAQQKLAEKLDDALKKLTPDERKRLADKMKKQAGQMSPDQMGEGPSKEDLEDLAKKLETAEGMKELEEQLKDMAKEDPGTGDGQREQGLEDAEKGLGEAEQQLGVPMPVPMNGGKPDGKGGKDGAGKDGKGDGKGPGDSGGKGDAKNASPGHSDGGGPGDHKGQTGVVDGPGMKARADGKVNAGKPMPGITMGRTRGRPGETANIRGTGALGDAAPSEIGGVDRSVVPEEYREQLGRYFQPK